MYIYRALCYIYRWFIYIEGGIYIYVYCKLFGFICICIYIGVHINIHIYIMGLVNYQVYCI